MTEITAVFFKVFDLVASECIDSKTRIRMSRMYTNKILTPLKPNPRPVPADHRIMRLVSPYDSTTILG